jgi:hypothetical protein
LSEGDRGEALYQAWLPSHGCETILHRLDSGTMNRAVFGMFENPIVLGVDVQDGHRASILRPRLGLSSLVPLGAIILMATSVN